MASQQSRSDSHWVHWGIKIGTVACAVIVGLALNFVGQSVFPDQTKLELALLNSALAASFGIIVSTWYDGYLTRHETKRNQELHQQILQKLSAEAQRDADFIRLAAQYGGTAIDGEEEMHKLWYELCWLIEKTYCATNYIDKIYDTPWAPAALAIQNAKVASVADHVSIRKIFIYDSEKEKLEKRPSIRSQNKLKLKEVLVSSLVNDSVTKAILDKEGGATKVDFGIFDDRYLLIWRLGPDRAVLGGSLVFDQKQIALYKGYFSKLWAVASDVP